MYWVGQKVCSCFSVASYEKNSNENFGQTIHTHSWNHLHNQGHGQI